MIFPAKLQRPLRQAGLLISLGLLVQTVTLYSVHPIAFMTFACVGMLLVAAGILRYLMALVSEG